VGQKQTASLKWPQRYVGRKRFLKRQVRLGIVRQLRSREPHRRLDPRRLRMLDQRL
jgi:hypothetical protein